MKSPYFILLSMLFLSACYDVIVNHDLSITNHSKKNICAVYSNGMNPRLTENNIAFFISEDNIIKPDSTYDLTILGDKYAWHNYIDDGKSKTLLIYIFETDTLKRYNNLYSIDDLKNMNKYLKILKFRK